MAAGSKSLEEYSSHGPLLDLARLASDLDFATGYFSSEPKKNDKDDDTTPSRVAFGILSTLSLLLFVFGTYNGYLLLKNGRMKKNLPLALFQSFSLLTLLGKWTNDLIF
jgi:hypothetical protein